MQSISDRVGSFDMNTMHIALQLKRHTCNIEVDLTVPTQGITALFGPSGSGKTTILRCLAGLDRITQARVRVGESVRELIVAQDCGYFFQNAVSA